VRGDSWDSPGPSSRDGACVSGEIAAHLEEVYGTTVSKETVGRITDSVIATMSEWQNRLLVGKDTVAKIWQARKLRPWKVATFKLSNDADFETKLDDVVGVYLDPPERAVVFCFDEKTQVQALDRTQPSLPLKAGRARR